MSLKPQPIPPIPEETVRIARAAFPKGSTFLRLRDELGVLYEDEDFRALFSVRGQPALPPWRLAVVTVMQFLENLSDRQAAEAVRARIDWKYALSLELGDPGFDRSVLSEFRSRMIEGAAEHLLLERMLERFRERGLVKARGKQRTDATHVLASVRVLNRLELVAETLRAVLNALATAAPEWLQGKAQPGWYERYAVRIEESRLPKGKDERDAYARTVGEDGFLLLDLLDAPDTPDALRYLPEVQTLRRVWQRHYVRSLSPRTGEVRLRPERELPRAAEGLESPYDVDARFRSKRSTQWTGYMVHLSETCETDQVHLITHVETTSASAHEATATARIHAALVAKDLPPEEHLVDAGYVSASLLVQSRAAHGIDLVGPTRKDPSWQRKQGGYGIDDFVIDWDREVVLCPNGKPSLSWREYEDEHRGEYISVRFRAAECRACPVRELCTRDDRQGRHLLLQPRAQHEALRVARARYASEEGRQLYARRAGVEGTISQGVRAFGLRRCRYRGLSRTHLQHVATAAAINLARVDAWLSQRPHAKTRISRFARLAA